MPDGFTILPSRKLSFDKAATEALPKKIDPHHQQVVFSHEGEHSLTLTRQAVFNAKSDHEETNLMIYGIPNDQLELAYRETEYHTSPS